jgi:hypothetical protein
MHPNGNVGSYYDPTLITEPKTSYIQSISTLFDLITPSLFHRYAGPLSLLTPEIILPTKALGGYGDHICSILWLGDKYRVWQAISEDVN